MGTKGELFEIEPREQVGARTGLLYEYQYHQAAAGALNVFDESDAALCIYCEWHDDYVIEGRNDGSYTFYQVKTNSTGPWTVGEFFGVGKLTRSGVRASSTVKSCAFSNLWDHTQKFGDRCKAFVFVSDAAVDAEIWNGFFQIGGKPRFFGRYLPSYADAYEQSASGNPT